MNFNYDSLQIARTKHEQRNRMTVQVRHGLRVNRGQQKMHSVLSTLCLIILLLLPGGVQAAPLGAPDQPEALDLFAYPALEVTQGVQTYKPSGNVPLVAGKRTIVFFYARVMTNNNQVTTAELTAERNGNSIKLLPLNANGQVALNGKLPDRYKGTRQFRFELPSNYLQGTVKLTAVLNPNKNQPAESDYSNNTGSKTVTFEVVPPLSLTMFDVRYKLIGSGDRIFTVADLEDPGVRSQRGQMIDWLRSAYPLNTVNWKKSSVYMGKKIKYNSGDISMLCTTVNLAILYGINHDSNPPGVNTRAYGMVSRSGAYMRGCAELLSDKAASGPTGLVQGNVHTSTGDDYGGHELAHMFGREHPNRAVDACKEGLLDSGPYPYHGGTISPRTEAYVSLDQAWGTAVLGVDVYSDMRDPKLYTHTAHDLMTYCSDRWMSDFSAKILMDYFQSHFSPAQAARVETIAAPIDRLMILGVIDAATQAVQLEPVYVVPSQNEAPNHKAGDFTIVLRNASGLELLRYPFAPAEPSFIEAPTEREVRDGVAQDSAINPITQPRAIYEAVPWIDSTARIEIEGPNGALLHTIQPGPGTPTVTVITPNGGTRVQPTERELEVSWSASDPDGDPLTFSVEYSANNGKSWHRYTDAITETTILLPEEVLTAGSGALVRVSASDGFHTGRDTSDAVFTVMNHLPTIELIPNASESIISSGTSTYAAGQTLSLEASAYDSDDGSLDESIAWSSNLDGELGTGPVLSTASLNVGTHTITAEVKDSAGKSATVQTKVMIVPTLADLPPVPDQLIVTPKEVYLSSLEVITETRVLVNNLNVNRTLTWNASTDQPWVALSSTTGETGSELTVSRLSDSFLPDGEHAATLTLTSPELPGVNVKIPVIADVQVETVYLPLVQR